jgi:glycosidase
MKRSWLGMLFLMLSACTLAPEEPLLVQDVTHVAPSLYLNHEDRPSMPLATGLEDIGVCYQIFVISFADSNHDGYGDLNGITAKLDYLADLNVQCLWLTPINPSPSYHKYDVTDYFDVDPVFGTLADFDRLIAEARQRGIVILMDLVINHTSKQHPWFVAHPEYYRLVSPNHPDYNMRNHWHRHQSLMYYAYFWDQMPELNLDHPEVRALTFEIAAFWLARGVGGFRLDAVRHLFDTLEYPVRTNTLRQNILFLKAFNEAVKTINPSAIVLAEVWSEAAAVARYLPGVDSAFNFDLATAILTTVRDSSDSVSTNVVGTFLAIQALYDNEDTAYHDSIFLTNHDVDRVINAIGGSDEKAKLAASILFTLPGVSWIYYGEELGMHGVRSAGVQTDAERRQPMPWQDRYQVAAVDGYRLEPANQLLAPGNAVHQHYQQASALKLDPVIRLGTLQAVTKTQRHFLAYTLTLEDTTYLVVHNLSVRAQPLRLDVPAQVITTLNGGWQDADGWVLAPYASVLFNVNTTDIALPFD